MLLATASYFLVERTDAREITVKMRVGSDHSGDLVLASLIPGEL